MTLLRVLGGVALLALLAATCVATGSALIVAVFAQAGGAALLCAAGCLLMIAEAKALVALLPAGVRARAGL